MGKKILVVDDDFDTLKSIDRFSEGRIRRFRSDNALQALNGKTGFPHLNDVIMPNLSGYELLRILRRRRS